MRRSPAFTGDGGIVLTPMVVVSAMTVRGNVGDTVALSLATLAPLLERTLDRLRGLRSTPSPD
jgi:hypothetical protein